MRSNLQIVSEHYAASDRGDLAAMLADVAPDARWTEMAGFPCEGTWIGPAQIAAHVFKVLVSEWNDYRMTLESLVDGGDCIVGIGTYSGTYKRTGRGMQARVAHVWRLAGGKIVAFEQFTDTLLVANAMET
ncbi:nuclear transport factor 2 family protein [Massilia sp. TW-1]|uniref:Nuclear transport factor 2 family protein n=1 Tax=Telluria antibiotica TaxID=2717319 RepID=A0ABX0P6R4_9BURK|nr:nuclear transport factor 2 family protein [Telluria antibiotica]NIA52284.1 nuclear transport factor 2 family protein [Telluria antibiotica]